MRDGIIDPVSISSRIGDAADYDRVLAGSAIVARIKNPGRKTTKTAVLVCVCDRYAAIDFYAIHDLFCSVLRAVCGDAASSQIYRERFAQITFSTSNLDYNRRVHSARI